MRKIAPFVIVALLTLAGSLPAMAQSGCTGDPCLFFTPTPNTGATATPQPTPGPGTPTAVPMGNATGFPQYQYGIPTGIPTIVLPATPNPNVQLTPLATFAPFQAEFTPPPLPSVTFEPLATPELPETTPLATFIPFAATPWHRQSGEPAPTPPPFGESAISPGALATFAPFAPTPWSFGSGTPSLTVPGAFAATPLAPEGAGGTAVPLATMRAGIPITYTEPLTQFNVATDTFDLTWYSQTITDVISYTNSVTNSVVQPEQVITVITAPADYVPDLPRPLANIGWTFEQLGSETAQPTYTVESWAALVGYMAAAPFQLVKMLWAFAVRWPVLSLILAWLFVALALVLTLRLIRAIYHLIWTIVDLVIKLIDLIGQYLPTGG